MEIKFSIDVKDIQTELSTDFFKTIVLYEIEMVKKEPRASHCDVVTTHLKLSHQ